MEWIVLNRFMWWNGAGARNWCYVDHNAHQDKLNLEAWD